MVPAAVIFDNDGLALDTEAAWTRAEKVLFARRHVEFTMEHKRALLGTSPAACALKLEAMLGSPTGSGPELVRELHHQMLSELEAETSPMPGLLALLDALRAAAIPVALASNSPRELIERGLLGSGLQRAFAVTVAGDEVEHPKPAPDVYLAAAAGLGADPARCVALEDSPVGVAAARAAGMRVIGVPSVPGVVVEADVVATSLADDAVWSALGLTVPVT